MTYTVSSGTLNPGIPYHTILAGCNAYTVRRLQRVQNTAARLVLDVPVPYGSRSHPLLRELHWLPIESRIKFKLCVLMYPVCHGTAPLYLCELRKPCTDSRLRSKSKGDFSTPRTRLRFPDKAFAVSAPSAWNSLPIEIPDCSSEATFYKHLKTFLFRVVLISISILFLFHSIYCIVRRC